MFDFQTAWPEGPARESIGAKVKSKEATRGMAGSAPGSPATKEDWKSILAQVPPTKPTVSGWDRVVAMARVWAPIAKAQRKEEQANTLRAIFGQPQLKSIDKWMERQDDPSIDMPQAIRRLLEIGLAATAKRPSGRASKMATAKAKELAAEAIDHLSDASAPAEEQASRKRRLLKGPEEFREVRVDRAKAE